MPRGRRRRGSTSSSTSGSKRRSTRRGSVDGAGSAASGEHRADGVEGRKGDAPQQQEQEAFAAPQGVDELKEFAETLNAAPQTFAAPSASVAAALRGALKVAFDAARRAEPTEQLKGRTLCPIGELYLEGFDTEQLWEEVSLQNGPALDFAERKLARFVKHSDKVTLPAPPPPSDGESDASSGSYGSDGGSDGGGAGGDPAQGSDSDGDAGASHGGSTDDDDDDDAPRGFAAPGADSDSDDGASSLDSEERAELAARKARPGRGRLNDGFFRMDDMEAFLDRQDAIDAGGKPPKLGRRRRGDGDGDSDGDDEEDEEDDDEIDLFADVPTSDDDDDEIADELLEDEAAVGLAAPKRARGPVYDDFFDPPSEGESDPEPVRHAKKPRTGGDDAGDDAEGDAESDAERSDADGSDADAGSGADGEEGGASEERKALDSAFARREAAMRSKVGEIEDELIAEKPWHLSGEATHGARPQNSLLEVDLEFERAAKLAPPVTLESTAALEDIIKQRIADEAWDDVERKEPPKPAPSSELPEVSQEKSKEGLADIYAKDYAKQVLGASGPDAKQQTRDEISMLYTKLCGKLDALTNFHFTPKPVVEDLTVKPNVPAVAVEEVIPAAVSDATLRAPEEVYARKRGREAVVRGEAEMTQEERGAARRAKKAARRKARRQRDADQRRVERLNPGLGNKYAKARALEEMRTAKNVSEGVRSTGDPSSWGKSAQFFAKLQEEAKATISGAKEGAGKHKAQTTAAGAALKL